MAIPKLDQIKKAIDANVKKSVEKALAEKNKKKSSGSSSSKQQQIRDAIDANVKKSVEKALEAEKNKRQASSSKAAAEKAAKEAKEQQRQERINQQIQLYLDRNSKTFIEMGKRRGIDPRLLASQSTGGRGIAIDGNRLILGDTIKTGGGQNDIRTSVRSNNAAATFSNNFYDSGSVVANNVGMETNIPTLQRIRSNRLTDLYSNVEYTIDIRGEIKETPRSGRTFEGTRQKLENIGQFSKSRSKRELALAGSGILGSVGDTIDLGKSFFTPVKSAKALGSGLYILATDKTQRDLTIKQIKDVSIGPASSPSRTTGFLAAEAAQSIAIPSALKKSVQAIYDVGVVARAGGKFKPITTVAKTESFVISPSLKQSIQGFESAKSVVTASPTPLRGTVSMTGRKASAGLEDPGTFVTVRGKAQLPFLRISGEKYDGITLNPIKSVKDIFSPRRPTITEFENFRVLRLPTKVKKEPGFKAVDDFFTERPKDATIFITKRSEIGQGALKPKKFTITEEQAKIGQEVFDKNRPIPKTQIEKGTKEDEAIIPKTQRFSSPKIQEFTLYQGRVVQIRKSSLIDETNFYNQNFKKVNNNNVINRELSKLSQSRFSSLSKIKTSKRPLLVLPGLSTFYSGSSKNNFGLSSINLSSLKTSPLSPSKTTDISLSNFTSSDISIPSGTSRTTSTTSTPSGGTSTFTGGGSIRLPPRTNIPLISDPIIPKPPIMKKDKKEDKNKGYDVFIKDKGKYFKANKVPKNYGAAWNLGASAVDNSAAATFKVKPSGKKPKVTETLNSFLMKKFRQPKGKSKTKVTDTFIEKRKHRIDSQGEIQGISAKGWIASRNRKSDFKVRL